MITLKGSLLQMLKTNKKRYVIYAMVGHMKRLTVIIVMLNAQNVMAIIFMTPVICNNLSAALV